MGSTFAKTLERLMQDHKIKPTAIAEIAKVGRQTVYNWLDDGTPRSEPLRLLSKHFGVTEAELMYGRIEYNNERLAAVIEMVEKAAAKDNVALAPSKKAKLITVLYEKCAAGHPPTKQEVADLVALSA